MPFVVIVGSVLMTVPLVITYGLGDVIAEGGPNLVGGGVALGAGAALGGGVALAEVA